MPALDVDAQLDTAIWTLLEANSDFTDKVKSGSRMKAYAAAQRTAPVLRRAVSEYPQVAVAVTPADVARNTPQTFAMNSTSYTPTICDVPIPFVQVAAITITYSLGAILGERTPLESTIRAALFAKFTTLGIAGVTGISFRTTRGMNRESPPLPFTRIDLTVNRRLKLSQLV